MTSLCILPINTIINQLILKAMANMLGNHRVHWKYVENGGKKTTICTIENRNREVVATGEATRFHKDTDDRKVARAVTFKRAMNNSMNANSIDKPSRGAIWDDFRTKINQPETL
jgi:hypothetical protein